MIRTIAINSAPYGIWVIFVVSGPVETPMLRVRFNEEENSQEQEDTQKDTVLLKRFARCEEIARIALFLTSNSSSYMTGAMVVYNDMYNERENKRDTEYNHSDMSNLALQRPQFFNTTGNCYKR
jgi:NAD(P)-dependent dehydrogenase (short-subunit alcohol dehydrogenase family)